VVIFLYVKPGSGVGATAPDVTIRDASGKPVRIADYQGQVVVLDFWASWCPPCRAAMPAMDRLYKQFGDRGAVVFGVNINDNQDPVEFMARMGVSYPLLVNGEGAAKEFGVKSIPTLVIIGVDGQVLYRESGWAPHVEQTMAQIIEKNLTRNAM
jgi:thiol-disulfide isomerase/thioredoxin